MLAGMGTELQCSPNFFTTLPRSHGNAVTISFDPPDTRASSKDRPLKETTRTGPAPEPRQQSMERLPFHKESLRKTMLEHEKVFKEQDWTLQVRELHRLYRTQKLLMSQLQNREPKLHPLTCAAPGATPHPSTALWSGASGGPQASISTSTSNRHHHGAQLNSEHICHAGHRSKAGLSSQELRSQSDGDEHQPPSAEGMPTGVGDAVRAHDHKFSVEAPSCSDEECDLELTLSTGCGGSKKRAGPRSHSDTPSGCRPESSANSSGHQKRSTPAKSDPGGHADPSVGFDRESLQRPAWLFQGLSLNRT